jgi:hypothetical protein
MHDVPDTIRSHGTPPKAPPMRRIAWATYEVIAPGRAFYEVTYLDNQEAFSMGRVDVANPRIGVNGIDPLYEATYNAASVAARIHGYELERFAQA